MDSDQDGDVTLKCNNVEGGQLYPEEVSGQILAHMLAHAEQSMQASISKAVISVRTFSSMPGVMPNHRVKGLCWSPDPNGLS